MRITSVSANIVRVPLVKPFIIASGTQTHYHGVIVQVKAGNLTGWGEAAPSKRVTGETERSVIRDIKRLAPRLKGKRPSKTMITNFFDPRVPSATAALDTAVHDLVGQMKGKRVLDLYRSKRSRQRSSIETSITVSVGDIRTTIQHARELVNRGTTTLKVKIGTDPGLDIKRIQLLRNEFPKVKIRLDGNQGYRAEEAVHVLRSLEPYRIQFIEQPVRRSSTRVMTKLTKTSKIPIMADEALTDFASLEKIIKDRSADMINIKLMKVGGIREGHRMASRAIKAGLGIMVGCMIETRVGITAGTHLALAEDGIEFADLDGHMDLNVDIANGGVRTRLGRNRIPGNVGLGLIVTEAALKKWTSAR